jgi:hypothetical protein
MPKKGNSRSDGQRHRKSSRQLDNYAADPVAAQTKDKDSGCQGNTGQ